MKKTGLKAVLWGATIFFIGFVTGQHFDSNQFQAEFAGIPEKIGFAQNLAQNTPKPKEETKNSFIFQGKNASIDNDKPALLPHEQEKSIEAKIAREEAFYSNQRAELDTYEAMLDSMIENKLPQEEIDAIKNQIAAIESTKFEDPVDQNQNPEDLSVEKMREDLAQSLRQNTDISNEDLEAMVDAMFPLENNEAVGDETSPTM